jgi:hypothetical protein
MMHLVTAIASLTIIVLAAIWFCVSPNYEPAIAFFGGFAGLIVFLRDPSGSRFLKILKRIFIPRTVFGPSFQLYIERFLATNRCPPWDEHLCDRNRIAKGYVHYTPRTSADPPAYAGSIDSVETIGLQANLEHVPRFIDRLLTWRTGIRGERRNVFLLLGDPGVGKSSLAIQIAQELADRVRSSGEAVVPVYINLAEFDDAFECTSSGLELLTTKITTAGCPRYGVPIDTSLPSYAQALISPHHPSSVFFILDSMDELPTVGYTARAKAIADFITAPSRRGCYFLVTCRYDDFIKLADHTHNLQIQRLDLLPWCKKMTRSYLRLRGIHDAQVEVFLTSSQDACTTGTAARSLIHPLAATVYSRTKALGQATLSQALETFFSQVITDHIGDSRLSLDDVLNELGRIAFEQTWSGMNGKPISDAVKDVAMRAGLVRSTPTAVRFEIRPIMQHLAARELLRRVRAGENLPDDLLIQELATRQVFRSAGEQARTDEAWGHFLIERILSEPADMRTQGDRLMLIASCVTSQQLRENPLLRRHVSRLLEFLVTRGDDFEKERCQQAVRRQPTLIEIGSPKTLAFLAWIPNAGSSSALSWLIQSMGIHKELRRSYPKIWWRALSRALDEGTLGRDFQRIALIRIAGGRSVRLQRIVDSWLLIFRLLVTFIGHYTTYVFAWTLALMFAARVYRYVPGAPSLQPLELWLRQFDITDLPFQVSRLWALLAFFYFPRYILIHQERARSHFRKLWKRYLLLIAFVFLLRLTNFLWALPLSFLQILRLALLWICLAYWLCQVCYVIISILRNPADWMRSLREMLSGRRLVRASTSRTGAVSKTSEEDSSAVSAIVPSDILLNLGLLGKPHDLSPRSSNTLIRIMRAKMSIWITLWIVVLLWAALSAGLTGVVIASLTSAVAILAYVYFLAPFLLIWRTRRDIRAARRSMSVSTPSTVFALILREINDTSHLLWVRALWMDLLRNVRFDKGLYSELESLYAALEVQYLRNRLTPILQQARHEVQRGSV